MSKFFPNTTHPDHQRAGTNLGAIIDTVLNGPEGNPRELGFILLIAPFGEEPGRTCSFVTNGVARGDAAELLEEMAQRLRGEPGG